MHTNPTESKGVKVYKVELEIWNKSQTLFDCNSEKVILFDILW